MARRSQVRWLFRFQGQTKTYTGVARVCVPSILSIRFSVFHGFPWFQVLTSQWVALLLPFWPNASSARSQCRGKLRVSSGAVWRLKTTEASVETTATRRFAFWWSRHAFISCPGTWARLIFEDKQSIEFSLVMKFEGTKCFWRFGSTWIVLIGFGTGVHSCGCQNLFLFVFCFRERGRGNGKSSNFCNFFRFFFFCVFKVD